MRTPKAMRYNWMKAAEALVLVAGGVLSAGAWAGDWLLDPKPYEAKITLSDDRVVLENGLVSRTITLKPAPATISIRNLTTGDEHLRAISPEARVTIDGKGCDVGGLLGQPILNYLKTEWLAKMRPYTNAYAYVKSEQGPIEARFPCKLHREWMSRDLSWPPKGRHLMMHYAPQKPGLPHVTVHYEIYDGVPLFSKWLTVENRSGRDCTLTTFVTDEIRFVEYSDILFSFAGDVQENFTPIAEDVCGGGERIGYQFCKEPDYKTQRPYFYEGVMTLKFTPGCNVDVRLPDRKPVECFRSWLLLHDSSDRERRSLAIRRTYRTLAPWTDENPLLFHLKQKATPQSVREGVRQCAETGFEAMIISFGTGFNLESTDPAYRATYRAIADEAKAKNVVIGGYSLTSSRNAGTLADNVKGKCLFDRGPCLGSVWGKQYIENLKSFMDEAGFGVFENDGPYPGDFCSATNHPGHTTAGNSYWVQWHAQADLYRFCRARGIYVNQPDWYFLIGGNKTGMGYRESNWTLPREYQTIIERQNIYNGTWNKSTSMGWMFIPLSNYHNGGKGSIVEPLRENLAHYDQRFADTFGAGVQSLLRGPRLFDSPETLAVVRKWVKFFKDHRRVLTGDFIHLRRADGRDWDGWVMADAQGEEKALAFFFNPTDQAMTRKIAVPLYYAGLKDRAMISVNGGAPTETPLDAAQKAHVTLTIPANGYLWLLVKGI